MKKKDEILDKFMLFSLGTGEGIGSFITDTTDDEVFRRLSELIDGKKLSLQEFNQLLLLAHEASITPDFFQYYWLETHEHNYDIKKIEGFDSNWFQSSPTTILSLEHLRWGMYRLYVDSLLYFGNVRTGFRKLRMMQEAELKKIFQIRRFDTKAIKLRGPALPLKEIAKDNRYLISEMACKSYGEQPQTEAELKDSLLEAWELHKISGGGQVKIRDLLDGTKIIEKLADRYQRTLFSADDILDEYVSSESDIDSRYSSIAKAFMSARSSALHNTKLYLSMVNELDVYVATSMRTRKDFREMADTCDKIFSDSCLKDFQLRYFDPTMSAAEGHEDKGLIECLMVKCAKVLIYCAGEKESYGKDAEASMALSLGKPVIFYCNETQRKNFYRDTHPLSRLIEFETGVAVGAMVTDSLMDVSKLLARLFENKMEYKLEQHPKRKGYIRLVDLLTNSAVRIQTNHKLLTETFWNHYQNK
ncbi:MAG: hypothetical protein IH886_13670 [Nitrospinae bacterium]|nr:hypothetical protein [Nitrospinota bacterium]